jgi:hypothetical protein
VQGKYDNDEWLFAANPDERWVNCYHGTHPTNIRSIIKHGLLIGGKHVPLKCGNVFGTVKRREINS